MFYVELLKYGKLSTDIQDIQLQKISNVELNLTMSIIRVPTGGKPTLQILSHGIPG